MEETVVLPNRRRLRIRPLRRCEVDAIRALYERLSARTRYQRFFAAMPTLSESMERLLACIDPARGLALVAETIDAGTSEVVALGSFVASDEAEVEIGLVVRDDWQRQRVGTVLLGRVVHAAEERGYRRFSVAILSDNIAAEKLLKQIGDVVSSRTSRGIADVVLVSRPVSV